MTPGLIEWRASKINRTAVGLTRLHTLEGGSPLIRTETTGEINYAAKRLPAAAGAGTASGPVKNFRRLSLGFEKTIFGRIRNAQKLSCLIASTVGGAPFCIDPLNGGNAAEQAISPPKGHTEF